MQHDNRVEFAPVQPASALRGTLRGMNTTASNRDRAGKVNALARKVSRHKGGKCGKCGECGKRGKCGKRVFGKRSNQPLGKSDGRLPSALTWQIGAALQSSTQLFCSDFANFWALPRAPRAR